MISFACSKEDHDLAVRVARRYETDCMVNCGAHEHQQILMDLVATHCNGNPMDFAGLLDADLFNFSHDVSGIRRHIDRSTGRLVGFFVPRYSRKEEEE